MDDSAGGTLSYSAAEVLFASLAAAKRDGPLPERLFVLELGIGVGLFARFFLDAFRDLCRAMQALLKAMNGQAGKTEVFHPRWDRNEGVKSGPIARENQSLSGLTCQHDQLPQPATVDLTDWLPFLALG